MAYSDFTENELREVYRDDENKKFIIYNELFFYGELATNDLVENITQDVANNWNEPNGKVLHNDELYEVEFIMKGFLLPFIKETDVTENTKPWRKFFKLAENTFLDISFVDGLYANTGMFKIKNIQKKNSKTAPHELGHTWGLKHPLITDYRGQGQPHIMLPRGSFVDPPYRYKPEANLIVSNDEIIMEEGFTVNTDLRKVLQKNIDDLELNQLDFDENNMADISILTNKFYL